MSLDNGYTPPQTVEQARLLQSDEVALIFCSVGTGAATLRSQETCRARTSIAQPKRQQVVLENRYTASPKGSLDFDEPVGAMALAGSAIVSIWRAPSGA